MNWIQNMLTGVKGRAIRSVVSLGLGLLLAKYQGNVWYVSATPLLQTIGKALRDKYPGQWEWLPF
jgi:hypothetical protein